MIYIIALMIIIGCFLITFQYIKHKTEVSKTEGFAKRKAAQLLFWALTALLGFAPIIVDVVYSKLGIDKPNYIDFIPFAAFVTFAIAIVLMFRDNKKSDKQIITQSHSGSGDNIGGNKVIHNHSEKKK